jgi:hypothetical protein
MNFTRCEKGHLYDADLHPACPHCNGVEGREDDISATVKHSSGGVNPTVDNQGVTMPKTEAHNVWGDSIPVSDVVPEEEPSIADLLKMARESKSNNVTVKNEPEGDTLKTMRYSPAQNIKTEPVVGWLVCISGEEAGRSFELKTGRNFIGRSTSMDVVLKDQSVSRDKHAIIVYEPRKREFIVQPGESKELFYLNDDVVLSSQKIKNFDKLIIGNTQLYFIAFCSESFAWEDLEQ